MRALLQHPLTHCLAGMCLMGSWAAFSNRDFPMPAPLIAGLTQGVLTGVITFLMHRVISRVFARIGCWICAALAGMITSAAFLLPGHLIAATPAFWQTVTLPLSVACLYTLSFAYSLRKT